jgi:hypothetical protein
LLSLPRGTEMFQFPRFPLPAVCVRAGVTPHDGCRVSPFGYPRIKAWSAAPRGFSQPPTSFIGVRRQGIHRWLFVAWKNKDARARYVVLKERRRGPHGSESGDEDAGVATVASPAEPRDEGRVAPSKQKRGRSSGPGSAAGRETPTTDGIAVDRTERGSNWESSLRNAGNLDSLERR